MPGAPPEARADAPLAFVAKLRGGLRLTAVDARAQAQGIHPGMTLADARALHPALRVAAADAVADRRWLRRLARRCGDWSPRVTLVPPDGITLDIAGSAHLFGGEPGLVAQVEEAFAAIGMALRLAAAATAQGAQALARHAPLPVADEGGALRALPLAALQLADEDTLALHRAGLRTVGDVAARPAATIAARFGAAAITALRRLTGDEQAPIDALAPADPLHFERRFAEPVALQATIAAGFLALLRTAAVALEQRGLGGRRYVLTLFRSDGARHRLSIDTGLPTRDPALVLRLFDERIAALADPFDPGFGYDSMTLSVPVAEPLGPQQPGWAGDGLDGGADGAASAAALAGLIDRLSARLGPGSIRRLMPHDSHMPEQAQHALPAMEAPAPVPWPAPAAGEPPVRPLFLFDPPQPVEVIAEVPDGPPHRFRWQRRVHDVRLYEGPERIAAQWWRRIGGEAPGRGGLTRDYYRIEDAHGRRYWIFRHGLYEETAAPRWYLHGLFA